ncbi:hypothetical protein SAMN05216327_108160 [Dyadobacter sp. SG02]|nr:hypothetical protein SAMN05216327_108160 [Dyadobacter sp. SG02]
MNFSEIRSNWYYAYYQWVLSVASGGVEYWEVVGLLVKYATEKKVLPRGVREDVGLLEGFQEFLRGRGLSWGGRGDVLIIY